MRYASVLRSLARACSPLVLGKHGRSKPKIFFIPPRLARGQRYAKHNRNDDLSSDFGSGTNGIVAQTAKADDNPCITYQNRCLKFNPANYANCKLKCKGSSVCLGNETHYQVAKP